MIIKEPKIVYVDFKVTLNCDIKKCTARMVSVRHMIKAYCENHMSIGEPFYLSEFHLRIPLEMVAVSHPAVRKDEILRCGLVSFTFI